MINHYLELHEYINKNIYKFPVKEDDIILEGINWVKGLAVAGLGALIIWVFKFFINKNKDGLNIQQQKFLIREQELLTKIQNLEKEKLTNAQQIQNQEQRIDTLEKQNSNIDSDNKELQAKVNTLLEANKKLKIDLKTAQGNSEEQLATIKKYKEEKEHILGELEANKKWGNKLNEKLTNYKKEYQDKVNNYFGALPDFFKNENIDELIFTLTNFEIMYKISWIFGINYNFANLKKVNLLQDGDFHYINELDINLIDPIDQFLNSNINADNSIYQNIFNKIFPGIEYNNSSLRILDNILYPYGDQYKEIIMHAEKFQEKEKDKSYKDSLDKILSYIQQKFPKISNENITDLNTNWYNIRKKYKDKFKSVGLDDDFDWNLVGTSRALTGIANHLKTINLINDLKQNLQNSNFLAYFNEIYVSSNWMK